MSERSISPYERFGNAIPEDAKLQFHTWIITDTMSRLADRYFGDWRLWRVIADRNQIVDVRRIEAGTQLIIPRRPMEVGAYESV